jgi:AcrR family transcriptional regulator
MTEDIKAVALDQIAAEGAAGLSLRAVSRELGVVSSAVYRYFASRDELLTALIADSYTELGDAASAADPAADGREVPAPERWRAVCRAWRGWALANPHRFQLLYGTPVPGYAAPPATIAAARHAVAPLVTVVADARRGGPSTGSSDLPAALVRQAAAVSGDLLGADDPDVVVALYQVFGQLVGLLTLELNGHLVGAFEPADDLWERSVEEAARRLAL